MFYFLIESRLPLCSSIVMPNVHKIVFLAWYMKLYEHHMTEISIRQERHLGRSRGVSVLTLLGGCKICTAQPYLGDTNKTKIRDTAGSMGPFTKDVRLTSGEGGLLIPDVPLLFECDSIVLCECGRGRGF